MTRLSFDLPVSSRVRPDVFDSLGRRVETVYERSREAGTHSVTWYARGVASGVYFARVTAGDNAATERKWFF